MNRFGYKDILSIVFAAVVLIYAIFRWKRRRLYELAAKIPGSDGLPIIGHVHRYLKPDMKNYVKVTHELCAEDKPLSKGWLGPKFVVLTQDPDTIHAVYSSPHCLNKPEYFYNALYSKKGLLSVNGSTYERHRKIFNRSFKPVILQRLISVFDEKAKRCMDVLKHQENKGEFDMYNFMGGCALDAFGAGQLNIEKDFYGSDVLKAVDTMKRLVVHRIFRPWFNIDWLYKLSNLYKDLNKEYNVLINFKDQVLKSNNLEDLESKDEIFVKQLLDSKSNFTEEEIIDEFVIFIIAGYETSALTLSSIILMLAMHQDVQQKLINEVDKFYTSEDGMISNDNINKIPYLDNVIKESMRLFTAGGIIARETSDEVILSGYTVPKGTVVAICAHAMHRNTRFWGKDANEFRPERFEPENLKNVHPRAYAPFTGGRRICIGYKYAMNFIKIVLIHFVRNYRVTTSLKFDELEVEMTPTLNIANGYTVELHSRK